MRRLISLLAILVAVNAAAQDFKILFVNTGTVRIGGKDLSAGDVFNKAETIHWVDAKQAIKALSLSDQKQFIFVSTDFKERKLKTAQDYLVRSNRLSTRGSGNLYALERQLGGSLYVLDTTCVSINYKPDESEYFFLLRDGNRQELEFKEGKLYFTPDIWSGQEDVVVDLYFRHSDAEEEPLIEGLRIIPLPESVKTKRK